MSKAIIDEYVADRDFYRNQATMWQYVATLLASRLGIGAAGLRFTKKDQNLIQDLTVVASQLKAGAILVNLTDATPPEVDA